MKTKFHREGAESAGKFFRFFPPRARRLGGEIEIQVPAIHKNIHRVAERGAANLWKAAEFVRFLFANCLYSPEAGILWKFSGILALTPERTQVYFKGIDISQIYISPELG